MSDKRKTLMERVEEATRRPLPYEGLTPAHNGVLFSPDEERMPESAEGNSATQAENAPESRD
jgi:hypothetical protein